MFALSEYSVAECTGNLKYLGLIADRHCNFPFHSWLDCVRHSNNLYSRMTFINVLVHTNSFASLDCSSYWTELLPPSTVRKLIKDIGRRRLSFSANRKQTRRRRATTYTAWNYVYVCLSSISCWDWHDASCMVAVCCRGNRFTYCSAYNHSNLSTCCTVTPGASQNNFFSENCYNYYNYNWVSE